jgi:hypothetical protein
MFDYDKNRYIAGGVSGIIEVLCTHPLDYLKTKKQQFAQKGLVNNFYQNLLKEKDLNLYRGAGYRIINIAPMRLTFWGVQDSYVGFVEKKFGEVTKKDVVEGACVAACAQTVLDTPIEMLKIQSMIGSNIGCIGSLFRGFSPTLFRNIGFAGCVAYIGVANKSDDNIKNFSYCALGGLVGSVLTQPIDYVKTVMQMNPQKNSLTIMRDNIYKNGVHVLYYGGVNRALLSFFSMGIGFVIFNNMKNLLD